MKRLVLNLDDDLHQSLMGAPVPAAKLARWTLAQMAANLDVVVKAVRNPDQYQVMFVALDEIPKHDPTTRQITGFVRQDRTSRTWHVDAPGCPTLESMLVEGYTAQTYPYGRGNYDPSRLPHLRVKTRAVTYARPLDLPSDLAWEPIWVLIQDVAYACDVDPELLRVLFPEEGLHIQVHGSSWEDHKTNFIFLIQHLNPKMPEVNIVLLHDQIRREWITPGYKVPPPY